jgi:hypothetical protein
VHGRQQVIALVGVVLGQRNEARQRARIALRQCRQQRRQVARRRRLAHREVALAHHFVDHALQAHGAPIVGREHARDAVRVQLRDLRRQDGAAASGEDQDAPPRGGNQVVHVLQELEVSALVAGQGDALGILLDGAVDDLAHRAVVAEVDDFGSRGLQQPPHDVDRGVVAVEQRGRRHQAHVMDGAVRFAAGYGGGKRRRGHRDLPVVVGGAVAPRDVSWRNLSQAAS